MSLEVGIIGGIVEALAPVADPEVIAEAVNDYLEDHPEATCPIDDTAGEGDTGKVWSADKSAGEVATLTEAIENVLVFENRGENATLTNVEDVQTFSNHLTKDGWTSGSTSYSDGVMQISGGNGSQKSPYFLHKGQWGTGRWVLGFKYKITKLVETVGDPSDIRIHLGADEPYYDFTPVWGEWCYFSKLWNGDLERIRFSPRGFATAPATSAFKVEIKEMFVYDATGLSDNLCNYILTQQGTNFQNGTVTYAIGEEGYFPDKTLKEDSKAADSKATGDAIRKVQINVKDFGVKGDGVTDDTDAINELFENMNGSFYFPAGTYNITGTIFLPGNSEMYGDGDLTVIDMSSCDDLAEKLFHGGDKCYPYIFVGEAFTKLHDFKLIGNATTEEARHAGICVLQTTNCEIYNLTIKNINCDLTQQSTVVQGYGIMVNYSDFVTVERCNVQNCGYECIGIVYSCKHCVVRDCYTKDGWKTCIQVHYNCKYVTVENNYMLQDHATYDACFTCHGLTDEKIENLNVLHNTLECLQNGSQAYQYCAPAQIMSHTVRLLFEGNKIKGGKRAFYITDDSTNAKIIGNDMNCNDSSDYGVWIKSLNTIVIGNFLENEASTPVNQIANNPILTGNIGIS